MTIFIHGGRSINMLFSPLQTGLKAIDDLPRVTGLLDANAHIAGELG